MVRCGGASCSRRVKHPNLVGVREMFEHDGRPVVVLDYVRGKTLREKIRALEGIRLNWFLTIVRALQKLAQARASSPTTATSSPRTSSSSPRARWSWSTRPCAATSAA